MSAILRLSHRVLGLSVRLDATADAVDKPIWIQIAKAGTFKGYHDGEFTFDSALFGKVVANFRRHPAYQAGADGKGAARVVPFDYEHASEMDPTSGSIPVEGAPAPAWALELEIRKGADDTAELWALTELTEQAREQIQTGGYQWTSIALWNDAIDPVSGTNIGPTLTSIAFTNQPFIQGMQPMRARLFSTRLHRVDVYGEAESPEELVIGLREILELEGEADADAIFSELVDLGAAYNEGRRLPGWPEGVGYLLDRVRRLIGLRILSTADQIVEAAGQALTLAASGQAPDAAATSPSSGSSEPQPSRDTMAAALTLTARIASIFKCRDTDDAITLAAQQAADKGDAYDKLAALVGSTDFQGALADVAALQEKAKKFSELEPAYQALLQRAAEGDKKDAEAEVDQVAASLNVTGDAWTRLRPLLLAERLACAGDPKKLEAFRAQYPVRADAQRQLLTNPQVAGPNGLQLGGPGTGYQPVSQQTAQHPLNGFPGANRVLKTVAYLTARREGFKLLDRRDQIFEAGKYLRDGAPVIT